MKYRFNFAVIAVAVFFIAAILVVLAFFTRNWLVNENDKIAGPTFTHLGLWHHCFRTPLDNYYHYYYHHQEYNYGQGQVRKYLSTCRWVYDPLVDDHNNVNGFSTPTFLILTEFFYTITFLIVMLCGVAVMTFMICCIEIIDGRYILGTRGIGCALIVAGICALIACLIFGFNATSGSWIQGYDDKNHLGWSFGLAIISIFFLIFAGALFLLESFVQNKKRKRNARAINDSKDVQLNVNIHN